MPYGTINADKITTSDGVSSAGLYGLKNRIINGDMRIDQRNSGSSVTPTASGYTLDRWYAGLSAASKYSVQQNAASVTPPTGFSNYLGVTSLSAYSITSGDYFIIRQNIEGFNSADLAWGTASAAPITLSFWVRSSLTGTFGGSLTNSAENRSYPFTYTISAANTWEQKSVTVAGDTTGTWVTNNGIGIRLNFGLGVGSTISGTAGSWAATAYLSATSATSVVGTNGATFYVTGVQLEKGSTATSYDYRFYGTELNWCQRYYWRNTATGIFTSFGFSTSRGSSASEFFVQFPVTMRAAPTTFDYSSLMVGLYAGGTTSAISSATLSTPNTSLSSSAISLTAAASIGSAGQALTVFANNSATAYFGFGAEL